MFVCKLDASTSGLGYFWWQILTPSSGWSDLIVTSHYKLVLNGKLKQTYYALRTHFNLYVIIFFTFIFICWLLFGYDY